MYIVYYVIVNNKAFEARVSTFEGAGATSTFTETGSRFIPDCPVVFDSALEAKVDESSELYDEVVEAITERYSEQFDDDAQWLQLVTTG